MALQTNLEESPRVAPQVYKEIIRLEDGKHTTVNYVKYPRSVFRPRVFALDEPMPLLAWCAQNNVTEAINGSYFRRPTSAESGKILGEVYVDSKPAPFEPLGGEHARKRGSLYAHRLGEFFIDHREAFSADIDGDLLQAGPILVHSGKPTHTTRTSDPEGFFLTAHEHDEPINQNRNPRAAIGYNKHEIVTVSVEGRNPQDAGMYLHEMAHFLHSDLGLEYALNLDGGSSTSHISGGELRNRPRTNDTESLYGFPIYSGVAIELIT